MTPYVRMSLRSRTLRACSAAFVAALVACTDESTSPSTSRSTTLVPNMLVLAGSSGSVVEVGSGASFEASVQRSGGGWGPNTYFHLDAASWVSTASGVAVIEQVLPGYGRPSNGTMYRTSMANLRAVGPGVTSVSVGTSQWRVGGSSAILHVMPRVRTFALHATRDTLYSGDTAFVYVVAELVDSSNVLKYFETPYLYFTRRDCNAACPAAISWTGSHATGFRIIANGEHMGAVTFDSSFGQQGSLEKRVVVLTGARPTDGGTQLR